MVFTAIFGGRDTLKDPLVVTPGCRYVCFTDEPLRSNVWEIVRRPIEEGDPRRTSRWYKILAHRVVDSEYSLWVDGNIRINIDVHSLIRRHLAQVDIATFEHPQRDCAYDEGEAVLRLGLDDPETVRRQLRRYRLAAHPEHAGLSYCGVLLRRHTPTVERLNEAWWHELHVGSVRDQISFRYCVRKLGTPLGIIAGDPHRHLELQYLDHRTRRDGSEFDQAEWRKLPAPRAVTTFPADLANTALEYAGVYRDGWLSGAASVGLGQPAASSALVVRAMIPLVNDPGFTTELRLLVDGTELLRQTLGLGEHELRVPVPPAARRRRVELRFSATQPLPEAVPRQVSALARFVGFED